jgi:hypothetical protein
VAVASQAVVGGCFGSLRADIARYGIKGNLSVLEDRVPLASELLYVRGFQGLHSRCQQSGKPVRPFGHWG